MSKKLSLWIAYTLGLSIPCSAENILDVPPEAPDTNVWCCFASSVMIMHFHKVAVKQCDEASERFGLRCCDSPRPGGCVKGGWPVFRGFNYKVKSGEPLTWTDVQTQINHRQPMAFSWEWPGGRGSHMMVLIGYKVENNINYVLINDPNVEKQLQQYWIKFDEYVGSKYAHGRDYFDVQKK